MMPSPKRSHATLAGSTSDASAMGAKLTYSLSKSLHDLLKNQGETSTEANESESSQDIYHQYLNSPPPNNTTNPSRYEADHQWKRRAEQWLSVATETMGVGSNINTFKFWREHGKDNLESFADGRYMVWLAKEILLGLCFEGGVPNGYGLNDQKRSPDYDENHFGDHLRGVLENWHESTLQLLSKNGAKLESAHKLGDDPTDADTAVEAEDDDTAGVFWQLLLKNAFLSPDFLRDFWENYSSPQGRYERSSLPLGNIDDDVALPAGYFAWPSFFLASVEAARVHYQEHGGRTNKRRRRNNSRALLIVDETKSIEWLPLFGYMVAYAFLGSNINALTMEEKIKFLKDNICDSLPSVMNIGNFDYDTKNSLLSGIIACVIDELGEWIVLDGLVLGDDAGVCLREERMNEDSCARFRASVGEVVDLLLVDAGILPKLATLTRTPLANLVAEISDAILNYSMVYHRLRLTSDSNEDHDNENINFSLPFQNHVERDAQQVVNFIDKANPDLKHQLISRKFVPGQYFSSIGTRSPPPHPIVVYTRALLSSNNLPEAAKLSYILEDCLGIDDSTKRHCYFLLYESMHEKGVLFEDGWNDTVGGATLANITVGALGRACALDYLTNVVLEAKDNLLSNPSYSRQHKKQAQHEVLCVKDAVRRTVLKFLLPRAYSPQEALTIASKLSDAKNFPQLEAVVWDANDSISVAYHILAARSLCSVSNGIILSEEDEDIFKKDEMFDIETQVKHGDAEELNQTKTTNVESIINEPAQNDYQESEHDSIEPTDKKDEEKTHFEDQENEVIDLEDLDSSSASDAASIEDDSEEEEERDVTYPRHYHQFAGNYSESDDYEEEDDEEADRHLAFQGMYDTQEGRGESGGEDNEGEQVDAIEILSSNDDDDEEEEEEDASSEEERNETDILNEIVDKFIAKNENAGTEEGGDRESEEEKSFDGRVLREAVHKYFIPANTGKKVSTVSCRTLDEQVCGSKEEVASIYIKEPSGLHNERRLADDMNEVKADNHSPGASVLESNESVIIENAPTPGAEYAKEEEKDDVDDRKECPHRQVVEAMDETIEEQYKERKTQRVDVEVAEGQLQFNEYDPSASEDDRRHATHSSEEYDMSDTDGIIMADDEQSIDTEEDKRSFAEASIDTEDEKRDGQVESQGGDMVDGIEDVAPSFEALPIQHQSGEIEHGKPSVLVVAAMSSQRQGNKRFESHSKYMGHQPRAGDSQSFDDTSAAQASTDANLWENYDDTSQGGSVTDMDRSFSVQLDVRYLGDAHTNSDDTGEDSSSKLVEDGGHTDDGYIPDAEVTEEEFAAQVKNDDARTSTILDGYVPDAELTEEEHPKKSPKKKDEVVAIPRVTENTSIDEGYVPDDTLTEEERVETLNTCAQGIHGALTEGKDEHDHLYDNSVIDDGNLPGDMLTEEERVEAFNPFYQGFDAEYFHDGRTTVMKSKEEDDHCNDEAGAKKEALSKDLMFGEELSQIDGVEEIDSEMEQSFQDLSTPTGPRVDGAIDPSALDDAEKALSKEENGTTAKASDIHDNTCKVQTAPDDDGGPSLLGTALQQNRDESESQGVASMRAASLQMHGDESFSDYSGEMKISDLPFIVDEKSFRSDVMGQNESKGGIESNANTTPKYMNISENRDAYVEPGVDSDGRKVEVKPDFLMEQASNAEANVAIDEKTDATQLIFGDVLSHASEISMLDNLSRFETAAADRATQQDVVEDVSKWTYKKLRNKLYELNTPVKKGWLKQDLVDWLQNHLANSVDSKKTQNPTSSLAEQSSILEDEQKDGNYVESGAYPSGRKPETPSTSRRSARAKKLSLKAALIQKVHYDTPVSELSHPAHSETDEDSVREQLSTSKTAEHSICPSRNGSSPGVPTAIVTRRTIGKKNPSLPVVPEGRIVEGLTIDAEHAAETTAVTEIPETDLKTKSKKATNESTRSKKSAPLKGKGNESASNNASNASRTRRAKSEVDNRSYISIASKTGVRSTRAASTKLDESEVPPKGESGKSRKKVDEGSSIASTRRSVRSLASTANDSASLGTRPSKTAARSTRAASTKLDESEVPPKGESDKSRKKVDEGSSIVSTRRSVRSLASTANDSASLGTRPSKTGARSTRAASTKLDESEVPPKGESGKSRKKVDEGSSIASTRRSVRSLASTANDSASLGTRRSSRRAKM